jgi:hypothetical protein
VSHAVVRGNEFVDLTSNLAFRIDDPTLFRDTAPRPRRATKPGPVQQKSLDPMEEYVELERSLQGEV